MIPFGTQKLNESSKKKFEKKITVSVLFQWNWAALSVLWCFSFPTSSIIILILDSTWKCTLSVFMIVFLWILLFWACSQNCKKRLSVSSGLHIRVCVCLPVRPPARVEQLSALWKDFHETWYLSIIRKSIKKIGVSIKYEKNNRYLT
jgi:hypothetical protein